MSALTKGRNTPARLDEVSELPVASGARLFPGALAAVNAAGKAVPMITALGLRGVGRAEAEFDNTSGADGDIRARIGRGTYRFANSAAGDLITAADIGNPAYGVDDQTVAKTNGSGTRSQAGIIFDVDAQGVWVKFN